MTVTTPGDASTKRSVESAVRPSDGSPFLSRLEWFVRVGSTNDVVQDWLADGTPEVCLAVAEEQTAGRGRLGRAWLAPAGRALLCSLGFRPSWLNPELTWRLAAVVALAMADAAEEVAGLPERSIRLKWPNDLVVEATGPADPRPGTLRKLAGVLGETDGLGSPDPRAIVGIGFNADWPAIEFPAELAGTMTSLNELSGARPIDLAALLDAFITCLEPRVLALRSGGFDEDDWLARQLTTGRDVRLIAADGSVVVLHALAVDGRTGALVVADPAAHGGERSIVSGEVVHVRLAPPTSLADPQLRGSDGTVGSGNRV